MIRGGWWLLPLLVVPITSRAGLFQDIGGCAVMVGKGFRHVADARDQRFLGKVSETPAACRGGDRAVEFRAHPWVDWANYWATGDASSKSRSFLNIGHLGPNGRGIDGALLD